MPRIFPFFVCLLLATASPCAAAQSLLSDLTLAAAVDLPLQPEQEGLVDLLFELRAERADRTLLVLTHFPQGLGGKSDAAVAALAGAMHNAGYGEVQEQSEYGVEQYLLTLGERIRQGLSPVLPERKARDWSSTFACVTTWELFKPSAGYASVLFRESRSGGGAHGNWTYRCLSLDLENGRELTLADLFADADSAQPLVGARVLAALGSRRSLSGGAQDLVPEDVDVSMDRIALTPEGLRIVYAPYEMGSYADGEFILDIPKAELLRMGAEPRFWQ